MKSLHKLIPNDCLSALVGLCKLDFAVQSLLQCESKIFLVEILLFNIQKFFFFSCWRKEENY